MVVATQVSVFGLYRPPLLSKGDEVEPPQTIISLASPDSREVCTTFGGVHRARGCPTICARSVSAASICIATVIAAPDDHFTAGPDCRVAPPGIRCVGDAGGCPTVRAWIVPPAGVEFLTTGSRFRPRRSSRCRSRLPYGRFGELEHLSCSWLSKYPTQGCIFRPYSTAGSFHRFRPRQSFPASPYCRVRISGRGRINRACGCPSISNEIVSRARIERYEFAPEGRSSPPQTIISVPVQTAV